MGRRIKSDRVYFGLNADPHSAYPDDRHVRCSRCGFISHLDRDVRGHDGDKSGWGLTYERSYLETTIVNGVVTSKDVPTT